MTKKILTKIDFFKLVAIVISVTLIVINFYRAYSTGITYDEAYTYLNYIHKNLLIFIKYLFVGGSLANNHILNSFLISVFTLFIPIKYNELLIRLPSLLFYILYLFYSYKISKTYTGISKYLLFGLLSLNYGVHEYFGLARGYGIACTCILISTYYLKQFINNRSKKNLYLTLMFGVLSCYANTVSLLCFASILTILFINLVKRKKVVEVIKNIGNVLFVIGAFVGTLIIIRYHFMVSQEGLPLYGAKDSFFNSVLVSFTNSFGFNDYSFIMTITLIALLVLILIFNIKKINLFLNTYISLLFVVYLVVLVILTIITKQMWLTERCLIPASPFLAIFITEIIDIVEISFMKKTIIISLMSAIIFTFIANLNLKFTRFWYNDYKIKNKAYEALRLKDKKILNDYPKTPILDFYKQKIEYYHHYSIY